MGTARLSDLQDPLAIADTLDPVSSEVDITDFLSRFAQCAENSFFCKIFF